MNRLLVLTVGATALAALAGCSGGNNAFGGIQAINATNHTITLYTGNTYTFDPNVDLSKWKVTDDVHITYTVDASAKPVKNMASSITTYP